MGIFEKFGDYMFFLLHAPLKKVKSGKNQLKIFFSTVGSVFDEMYQDILRFRRQKLISKADDVLLEVIGQDRDMFRYQGESMEQYRNRLQKKALIAELGGTNTGLLLAMEILGYPQCTIEPLYKTDRSRWAEIYIDILVLRDINYGAILHEVLKVKTARTLPYFRFHWEIQAIPVRSVAVGAIGNIVKIKARLVDNVEIVVNDGISGVTYISQEILVKGDNEIKPQDVYILEGSEKKRVFTKSGSIVRTEK